jgi:hypothetical protein
MDYPSAASAINVQRNHLKKQFQFMLGCGFENHVLFLRIYPPRD